MDNIFISKGISSPSKVLTEFSPDVSTACLAAAIAFVFCSLIGIGPFALYANEDWYVRLALFSDLVRNSWSITYKGLDGSTVLLRAPIGFYLPPALVAKYAPDAWSLSFLFIQTCAGLTLLLLLLTKLASSVRNIGVLWLVFFLFSGADIVGALLYNPPKQLSDHIEWWAGLFQYSSHLTQLFWVPNHAIPAWLMMAWLIKYFLVLESPSPGSAVHPAWVIFLLAVIPIWSPLAAAGLLPFVLVYTVIYIEKNGMAKTLGWANSRVDSALLKTGLIALVLCLIVVIFVLPYLTLSSSKIPSQWAWSGLPAEVFWFRYLEFIVLEGGLLGLLLLIRWHDQPVVWCAVGLILFLPLYRFGIASDLTMRASIPALLVLAVFSGIWFTESASNASKLDYIGRIALAMLLAVGMYTPLSEITRAVTRPVWIPNPNVTLTDVAPIPKSPHYYAPTEHPWIKYFLK